MFTTIRPRIAADDVAPSYGLVLTCRGEKYVQYYTVIQGQYYYVKPFKMQKSLTWGCGHHCLVPTLHHSGPMLEINRLFLTTHQPHPFPRTALFSIPQAHTCYTIFNYEDNIGMPETFIVRHNSINIAGITRFTPRDYLGNFEFKGNNTRK
jgi:hypothetical protein